MDNKLTFFKCCLALGSFFTIEAQGQNLVPDPGFEHVGAMPTKENNSIFCTKDWIAPNYAAGDYYNSNAEHRAAGVPENNFGKQEARSGIGYAGICVQNDLIEYLQSKLVKPLEKGKQYKISYYVSKAEKRKGVVNEFGIIFLDKIKLGFDRTGIPYKPDVEVVKNTGFKDEDSWELISGVYTAKGGESAFIIGYFNYDSPNGYKSKAHYYIDDVSIVQIDNETITKNVEVCPEQAIVPEIGKSIILKDVNFANGRSVLLESSKSELNQLSDFLIANAYKIEITGYTDNVGTEAANQQLSTERAKAVVDYLISKGIAENRLIFLGKGSSQPIASNDTEESRSKNRRVEFKILQ